MTCASQMGLGMWWAMSIPVLVFVGLVVVGILGVRALWHRVGGTPGIMARAALCRCSRSAMRAAR